jgi:hypothetical protein
MRTSRLSLVRLLRLLFDYLRPLTAIAVGCPMVLLLMPPEKVGFGPWHSAGKIAFSGDHGPVRVLRDGGESGLTVGALTGELTLRDAKDAGSEFTSLLRWNTILEMTLRAAICLLIFELLYQLCRNVEKGFVFTDRNLKLVRWLGCALTLSGFAVQAATTWTDTRTRIFIEQHFTFTTLTPLSYGFDGNALLFTFLNMNFTLLFAGLLVLALAEVFRHGLNLKQEAELTV